MTRTKFKEFLNGGAFLQVGPDTFNLLIGPFESTQQEFVSFSSDKSVIFQPHFWDFLDEKKPNEYLQATDSELISRPELLELLSDVDVGEIKIDWEEVSFENFNEQFVWSQKKFDSHQLQKTVPIIRQTGRFRLTEQSLSRILKNLISEKKMGWSYGFWQNGQGYLGHSPELICQWNQNLGLLKTTALAGTWPAGPTASEKLLADSKNLQEHQFVIEDMVKKLSHEPTFKQYKTEILELRHLVHLKTDFSLATDSAKQAVNIVQKLHPTAALGLFPPDAKSYEEFKKIQLPLARKNFGAPFAFIGTESVLAIASIRNFHFTLNEIQIFSGCGVTAVSSSENELTELTYKRNSVKKMMGFSE